MRELDYAKHQAQRSHMRTKAINEWFMFNLSHAPKHMCNYAIGSKTTCLSIPLEVLVDSLTVLIAIHNKNKDHAKLFVMRKLGNDTQIVTCCDVFIPPRNTMSYFSFGEGSLFTIACKVGHRASTNIGFYDYNNLEKPPVTIAKYVHGWHRPVSYGFKWSGINSLSTLDAFSNQVYVNPGVSYHALPKPLRDFINVRASTALIEYKLAIKTSFYTLINDAITTVTKRVDISEASLEVGKSTRSVDRLIIQIPDEYKPVILGHLNVNINDPVFRPLEVKGGKVTIMEYVVNGRFVDSMWFWQKNVNALVERLERAGDYYNEVLEWDEATCSGKVIGLIDAKQEWTCELVDYGAQLIIDQHLSVKLSY